AALEPLTTNPVSAEIMKSVLHDARTGQFGRNLLVLGGFLHDYGRSARGGARTDHLARAFCAFVWPHRSTDSIADLSARSPRCDGTQERRTDGAGFRRSRRRRHRCESGAGPAALSHVLAVGGAGRATGDSA